ncbi:transporter [Hespellia stercorisuis]|uniref:EamA-like transporter family protein n=1 Tax=Hespellia stercorisuis DSM 15480 TaxID=1121950 RepID=A0A1M6V2K1_9FIRM|nr:transporter [Hespellia stercorisuis]SHK75516.1 hypothetical protein SAMN02745243_03664 [Hespellia stercorisuis DSM 15480]
MWKQNKVKEVLILQSVILIYTLATVASKFASGYTFLSLPFIGFYGAEILILGVYAILWQQIIKKFDISIAYANRAFGIFWSLIWAVLFFKEAITWKNILGIVIVFLGIMVVNSDDCK